MAYSSNHNYHNRNYYSYNLVFKYFGGCNYNCGNLREYILTDRERKIIEEVLKGGRPDSFRVLKHLIDKSLPRLEEDIKLIKAFLKKVES